MTRISRAVAAAVRKVTMRLRLLSVLALGTLLLPAATNIYILATSPGNLSEVLARHHLALEEVLRNGIYEVTSAPGVSVSKLQKRIAGDNLVTRFEGDGILGSSESKCNRGNSGLSCSADWSVLYPTRFLSNGRFTIVN